jgi:hypothetical protein
LGFRKFRRLRRFRGCGCRASEFHGSWSMVEGLGCRVRRFRGWECKVWGLGFVGFRV